MLCDNGGECKMNGTTQKYESNDASGFVSISDIFPEALLDIRYYTSFNFTGARVDGYEQPIALMTKEAATALSEIGKQFMERGYLLRIYDAYRPVCAVRCFERWAASDDIRMKPWFYPEVEKKDLFNLGFVAHDSAHCGGSTVDLTLFDMKKGVDVEMGGAFDYFGKQSHYDATGLTDSERQNRALLREVMVSGGFRPIQTEWWHFTLQDAPYSNVRFTFPVHAL